ncbi:unnamed protein product [marine sediment metagenome]|uniref:Uncharacterized protein n=1 Tax=marine sediment metagenome TaxID=412755 RepID=X1TA98_9ZZZZ
MALGALISLGLATKVAAIAIAVKILRRKKNLAKLKAKKESPNEDSS